LSVDGTSGRPITLEQGVVFDWIDRTVGPGTKVTMVPYPILYGNYWENVAYWWNVEFWNASVQRAAVYEGAFTGTPETFPTTELTFDSTTGRGNVSPSPYAVQGIAETRFRLAGTELGEDRGVALIAADNPWRAEWLAFDLYRDDWAAEAGEQPTSKQISLCVPARGFADVQIHAPRYSPIYGDPRSELSFVSYARSGGVLVTGIALADETGPC